MTEYVYWKTIRVCPYCWTNKYIKIESRWRPWEECYMWYCLHWEENWHYIGPVTLKTYNLAYKMMLNNCIVDRKHIYSLWEIVYDNCKLIDRIEKIKNQKTDPLYDEETIKRLYLHK